MERIPLTIFVITQRRKGWILNSRINWNHHFCHFSWFYIPDISILRLCPFSYTAVLLERWRLTLHDVRKVTPLSPSPSLFDIAARNWMFPCPFIEIFWHIDILIAGRNWMFLCTFIVIFWHLDIDSRSQLDMFLSPFI